MRQNGWCRNSKYVSPYITEFQDKNPHDFSGISIGSFNLFIETAGVFVDRKLPCQSYYGYTKC